MDSKIIDDALDFVKGLLHRFLVADYFHTLRVYKMAVRIALGRKEQIKERLLPALRFCTC